MNDTYILHRLHDHWNADWERIEIPDAEKMGRSYRAPVELYRTALPTLDLRCYISNKDSDGEYHAYLALCVPGHAGREPDKDRLIDAHGDMCASPVSALDSAFTCLNRKLGFLGLS